MVSISTVLLALVVTIALMIGVRVVETRAEAARTTAAIGNLIADIAGPMLREKRYDGTQRLLQSAGSLLQANAAWLFLADGTLIGRSPQATAEVSLADFRSRQTSHNHSEPAIKPIVDGTETIGYIVVEPVVPSPLSGLETTLAFALVSLVAGVVIAFLAPLSIQRSHLRPLGAIARLSRDIAKGANLSRRLARSANNEIGDVADGFNYLVDQIELRDKAIRRRRRDVARVLESRRELQYDKAMAQAERAKKRRSSRSFAMRCACRSRILSMRSPNWVHRNCSNSAPCTSPARVPSICCRWPPTLRFCPNPEPNQAMTRRSSRFARCSKASLMCLRNVRSPAMPTFSGTPIPMCHARFAATISASGACSRR